MPLPQEVVLPMTILTSVSMFSSPVLNHTLITTLNMGLSGAAVAYVVEESILLLVCIGK